MYDWSESDLRFSGSGIVRSDLVDTDPNMWLRFYIHRKRGVTSFIPKLVASDLVMELEENSIKVSPVRYPIEFRYFI